MARITKIIIIGVAASIAITAAFAAVVTWMNAGVAEEMAATDAWARKATQRLRGVPGGENLSVHVPKSFNHLRPSWFLSVDGPVLDDATEQRLRAAFDAATPPMGVTVHWTLLNCFGDEELYKKMEGDRLDDEAATDSPSKP